MDQSAQIKLSEQTGPQAWPEAMGVPRGANLVLTADLTRIAWKLRAEGVAAAPGKFLDAFLQHLGPEGTLVVPTFNFDLRSGERYDPLHTPTISGALGQAALAHPAFTRTRNPLHSFAVAGRMRDRFMAADDVSSFGKGSPFALFLSEKFILLGLDMHLNYALSYFHHVEELEAVDYRRWRTIAIKRVGPKDAVQEQSYRLYAKRPGYENELSLLAPKLTAEGCMVNGSEDGISYLRIDLSRAHDVISNDIRTNGAGSIMKWSLRNWLRDTLQAVLPTKPSRSAQLLEQHHAGIR